VTTKTTRRLETAESEAAWRAHCAEMNRRYDRKAAELVAAGWRKHGRGRHQYFTKRGAEPLVIRRNLGEPNWYTTAKDF
jgi:hypothetical protein